jgi:hypothetical protein
VLAGLDFDDLRLERLTRAPERVALVGERSDERLQVEELTGVAFEAGVAA